MKSSFLLVLLFVFVIALLASPILAIICDISNFVIEGNAVCSGTLITITVADGCRSITIRDFDCSGTKGHFVYIGAPGATSFPSSFTSFLMENGRYNSGSPVVFAGAAIAGMESIVIRNVHNNFFDGGGASFASLVRFDESISDVKLIQLTDITQVVNGAMSADVVSFVETVMNVASLVVDNVHLSATDVSVGQSFYIISALYNGWAHDSSCASDSGSISVTNSSLTLLNTAERRGQNNLFVSVLFISRGSRTCDIGIAMHNNSIIVKSIGALSFFRASVLLTTTLMSIGQLSASRNVIAVSDVQAASAIISTVTGITTVSLSVTVVVVGNEVQIHNLSCSASVTVIAIVASLGSASMMVRGRASVMSNTVTADDISVGALFIEYGFIGTFVAKKLLCGTSSSASQLVFDSNSVQLGSISSSVVSSAGLVFSALRLPLLSGHAELQICNCSVEPLLSLRRRALSAQINLPVDIDLLLVSMSVSGQVSVSIRNCSVGGGINVTVQGSNNQHFVICALFGVTHTLDSDFGGGTIRISDSSVSLIQINTPDAAPTHDRYIYLTILSSSIHELRDISAIELRNVQLSDIVVGSSDSSSLGLSARSVVKLATILSASTWEHAASLYVESARVERCAAYFPTVVVSGAMEHGSQLFQKKGVVEMRFLREIVISRCVVRDIIIIIMASRGSSSSSSSSSSSISLLLLQQVVDSAAPVFRLHDSTVDNVTVMRATFLEICFLFTAPGGWMNRNVTGASTLLLERNTISRIHMGTAVLNASVSLLGFFTDEPPAVVRVVGNTIRDISSFALRLNVSCVAAYSQQPAPSYWPRWLRTPSSLFVASNIMSSIRYLRQQPPAAQSAQLLVGLRAAVVCFVEGVDFNETTLLDNLLEVETPGWRTQMALASTRREKVISVALLIGEQLLNLYMSTGDKNHVVLNVSSNRVIVTTPSSFLSDCDAASCSSLLLGAGASNTRLLSGRITVDSNDFFISPTLADAQEFVQSGGSRGNVNGVVVVPPSNVTAFFEAIERATGVGSVQRLIPPFVGSLLGLEGRVLLSGTRDTNITLRGGRGDIISPSSIAEFQVTLLSSRVSPTTNWELDCAGLSRRSIRNFASSVTGAARVQLRCNTSWTRSSSQSASETDPNATESVDRGASVTESPTLDPTATEALSASETASKGNRSVTLSVSPSNTELGRTSTPLVPVSVVRFPAAAAVLSGPVLGIAGAVLGPGAASAYRAGFRAQAIAALVNCPSSAHLAEVGVDYSPTQLSLGDDGQQPAADLGRLALGQARAARAGGVIGNVAIVACASLAAVACCFGVKVWKESERQNRLREQLVREREKRRARRSQEEEEHDDDDDDDGHAEQQQQQNEGGGGGAAEVVSRREFLLHDAMVKLRLPAAVVALVLVVGAPTVELAAQLLVFPGGVGAVWVLVAIVVLALLLILLPVWLRSNALYAVENESLAECVEHTYPRPSCGFFGQIWSYWMVPSHEWVVQEGGHDETNNSSRSDSVVGFVSTHMSNVCDDLVDPVFAVFDWFLTGLVAAVCGLSVGCTGRPCCITLAGMVTALALAHLLLLVSKSPHLARFDTWFARLLSLVTLVPAVMVLVVLLQAGSVLESVEALGTLTRVLGIVEMAILVLCVAGAACMGLRGVLTRIAPVEQQQDDDDDQPRSRRRRRRGGGGRRRGGEGDSSSGGGLLNYSAFQSGDFDAADDGDELPLVTTTAAAPPSTRPVAPLPTASTRRGPKRRQQSGGTSRAAISSSSPAAAAASTEAAADPFAHVPTQLLLAPQETFENDDDVGDTDNVDAGEEMTPSEVGRLLGFDGDKK